MESSKSYARKFIQRLKTLKQIWSYSDSQPTEIVMALSLVILAPTAITIELGGLHVFKLLLIFCGLYQLYCISGNKLECRLKASIFTFGLYTACTIMYLYHIGLPTPTHYGWIIFVLASFGSMNRLIKEKIHRNG